MELRILLAPLVLVLRYATQALAHAHSLHVHQFAALSLVLGICLIKAAN